LEFGGSILERLYNYYRGICKGDKTAEPIHDFLENYRNTREITDFLSAVYYGNKLRAMNEDKMPDQIKPMNFHCVQGKEEHEERSTSSFNSAEVDAVVERVKELCDSWPSEWGQRIAGDVLVTSVHRDQVSCLC
jgi:superfamily I DNA and/or RNA helicase